MAPVEVQHMQEPVVMDCEVPSDASTDEQMEAPLDRTQSQRVKQQTVQQVAVRLAKRHRPVQELQDATSALLASSLTAPGALEEVERQQRMARNLGEDLLEDTLALDSLANLFTEDRAARKRALADIDILTDKVDGAKAALLKRRREVEQAKVESEKQPAQSQEPAANEENMQQDCPETESEEEAEEAEEPQAAQSPAPPQQQRSTRALPSEEDWAKLKLPLRLQSREVADGWVVTGNLQGLSSEDVRVKIDDHDRSLLQIIGLRVPNRQELIHMHGFLQRHLGRQPTTAEDYLAAGEGSFGAIDEAIRLPENVDVSGIQATCRGGQLRLALPRRRQRPAPGFGAGARRSPHGAVDPFAAFRSPRFAGW